MIFLAVIAGTAASLLWIALVVIAFAAVLLYWPRRFSGPLTEDERRLAHRRLGGRSLAWALATPVLTILGFGLLLPPFVQLRVGEATPGREPPCEPPSSPWAAISRQEATDRWVEAVLCHVRDTSREGLAQAIVAAAADRFSRGSHCARSDVSPAERVSIELSLVELAARAYQLTSVVLDPGPRIADPDPWDIMKRTLDAREVATCRHAEGDIEKEGTILRLGPAMVDSDGETIEVSAVVLGRMDEGVDGKLWSRDETIVGGCHLKRSEGDVSESGQRVLRLRGRCDNLAQGAVLSAGFGKTRLRRRDVPVELRFELQDGSLVELLTELGKDGDFLAEMGRRDLQMPRVVADLGDASVVRREGETLVIAKSTGSSSGSLEEPSAIMLRQGPFSWAGFANEPTIQCWGDRVSIEKAAAILDGPADPSAMYALMGSIVWAANVLATGSCEQVRESPADVEGGQPLLTPEQIEEAVAAMRQGRDAVGMVCLALALVSLALGLLRSVR
ncbi:hypothetical protein OV203_19415 [Nannocystis sp. ILAH1]|uniref:hypothetical protein n=1 Tax=Nannocystis sp. ILAH1 TaxID=2996789 RepID=UPI00227030C6|nr:hypothetical protein [Nannocystis sp. ILAH1]MCY0989317.1 hypothetical protein [Nannocystis sp. ILAH1]